jgi:hypothetical protein
LLPNILELRSPPMPNDKRRTGETHFTNVILFIIKYLYRIMQLMYSESDGVSEDYAEHHRGTQEGWNLQGDVKTDATIAIWGE